MICVHPTAATNPATIAQLQITTGLRVVQGQKFPRLINPDGSLPATKPATPRFKNRMSDYTGPFNNGPWGGNAA